MRMDRKRIAIGVVGLGLIGALAGGGVAVAAAAGTSNGTGAQVAPTATGTPGHGPMGGFGMHGPMSGPSSVFAAAAKYLGLSETDLHAQVQAGKSLADVATAQGKSVTGLQDAIVAAIKTNLDANTTLSADQKAAILARVTSQIATMVTSTHPGAPGHGPMDDDDSGGMHRMGG